MSTWRSNWFCGNEVSAYGKENGYVDYATLAKAFDAVLNNNMLAVKADYWEQENGRIDNSEEIAELQERIEELEDTITPDSTDEHDKAADEQIRDLERKIEELREQEEEYPEVFQWYIISDNGASILKDYTNEIVYYNSELDMYLWGITHYGTSWDYVLTDIKIELDDYRA